jgi:hypothetical protein
MKSPGQTGAGMMTTSPDYLDAAAWGRVWLGLFDGHPKRSAKAQTVFRAAGVRAIKIYRIYLPKEQLRKLSATERSLFLLLGYASNQINALWKLIVVATNEGFSDPVEAKVSAAQTQIFLRLLIGVMREALKLIERRFLANPLGKEYVPRLSPDASAALDRPKRRFASADKLVVIRDNFAFHHPSLDDMVACTRFG